MADIGYAASAGAGRWPDDVQQCPGTLVTLTFGSQRSHKRCPISILISKDRLLLAPDKSSFILKPTFMVTFFYNYNLVFFFLISFLGVSAKKMPLLWQLAPS